MFDHFGGKFILQTTPGQHSNFFSSKWAPEPIVVRGVTWGPYKWPKINRFAWGDFTPRSGVISPYLELLFWGPLCRNRFCHRSGFRLRILGKRMVNQQDMTGGCFQKNPWWIHWLHPPLFGGSSQDLDTWLGTPIYKPFRPCGRGITTLMGLTKILLEDMQQ